MTEREYQDIQARLRASRGERQYATSARTFAVGNSWRSPARPLSKWWYFAAGLGLGFFFALGASSNAMPASHEPIESFRSAAQQTERVDLGGFRDR
ncbi:MAG: hypothetical protein AAFX40_05440 [Cyanobacteria bacterium J06639_1]